MAILAAAAVLPTGAFAQFKPLVEQAAPGGGQPAPDDTASAMVTAISDAPEALVMLSDTVLPGDTINLGSSGRLTLAYGNGCWTESFIGGVVTVGVGTSQVVGGQKIPSVVDCKRAQVAASADSAEAGAGVNRFDPRLWPGMVVVTSPWPEFRDSDGSIRVLRLDGASPQPVWEGQGGPGFRYPGAAPRLRPGVPYRVEAGGRSALFSIDPGAVGAGFTIDLR